MITLIYRKECARLISESLRILIHFAIFKSSKGTKYSRKEKKRKKNEREREEKKKKRTNSSVLLIEDVLDVCYFI